MVQVGPGGVVDTWAWVRTPLSEATRSRTRSPGPSSALTAPASASCRPSTPVRSTPCRRACVPCPGGPDEREGTIHDLECWEPEA